MSINGIPLSGNTGVMRIIYVVDKHQKRWIDEAISGALETSGAKSWKFGFYLICLSYFDARLGKRLEASKSQARLATRYVGSAGFRPIHAAAVERGIRLAINDGCDDVGHAIAHIARSYLKQLEDVARFGSAA